MFDIKICFEFAVELLRSAVTSIQFDDIALIDIQIIIVQCLRLAMSAENFFDERYTYFTLMF